MDETPVYLLTYDGASYPVTIDQRPVVQTINYLIYIRFSADDPFAAGYGGGGFTITEYQNGVPTGDFDFIGGTVSSFGAGTHFYVADGDATVTPGFAGFVPCFARDTLIATPTGMVAVQDLAEGASVTTVDGVARVVWLGHRRARETDVVRIREGVLGATSDLVVSHDHALFLDGVLVPAGLLVDGEAIVRERRDEVMFYHVELERHAILRANGVAAESYIDTGNRHQFGNCPLTYDPADAVQDPCAELVLAGARLDAIRARLARVPA